MSSANFVFFGELTFSKKEQRLEELDLIPYLSQKIALFSQF